MVDNESRLDRIEEKIDKLSEAMVSLARAEEKLVAMEQKYSSQYDKQNDLSTKIYEIERKMEANSLTISFYSKMFWLIAATATGTLATVVTQLII